MTDMIADLPLDDRPRERMMMHGRRTLSEAELLALILGSGMRGKSAVQLARELLRDGIARLGTLELADLARVPGVGPAKATRIAAAFEISRRINEEELSENDEYVEKAFGTALIQSHQFHQEHLGAAFLDAHNRVLKQQTVFIGTINHALVSPRDVVRYALLYDAVGVVLYHNHPSGNARPSAHDSDFTKKMNGALKLLDIELVDHLIIGRRRYYSMKSGGTI
jgi:DNA repair protein RadC